MDKSEAIRLLGGSVSKAAQAIGCSYQAVYQWPDGELPPTISDRVQAAIARTLLKPEQLGIKSDAPAARIQRETRRRLAREIRLNSDRPSNHRGER